MRVVTIGLITLNELAKDINPDYTQIAAPVDPGQDILLVPADRLILESPLNENLQVSIDGGISFEALPFDIGARTTATTTRVIFKLSKEKIPNNYAETVLRLATSNMDAFELGDELAVALGRVPIEIYFDGFRSFPNCAARGGRLQPIEELSTNGEVREGSGNFFCFIDTGFGLGDYVVEFTLRLSEPVADNDPLANEMITVIYDMVDDIDTGDTSNLAPTLRDFGSNGIYRDVIGAKDDSKTEPNEVVTLSLDIPDGIPLVLGETATAQFTILSSDGGANDDGTRPYANFDLASRKVNEGRAVRAQIELDRELDLDNLPDGLSPTTVLFRLFESDGVAGELPISKSNFDVTAQLQPDGRPITVKELAGPLGTVHTFELLIKQDDVVEADGKRTAFLRLDAVKGAGVVGGSGNKGANLEYTILDNEERAAIGPLTPGREGGTVGLTVDFAEPPLEDLDGENAYVREQTVVSYPGFGDVGSIRNIDDPVGFFEFGSDLLYYGRDYYGAYVSQDGFLVLSRDTASDAATVNTITGLGDSNLSLSDARLANLPIVAPYWDNFQSDGATIRAGSVGTVGQSDYEIVVEWSNLKFADRTERVTFQVRINLLSGQIRYYYGDVSDGYGRGSTIGLGDGRGTPLTIVDEPGRSLSADARYVNDGTLIRLDPNYVYIVTERVGSEAGLDSRDDILLGVPEVLRAADFEGRRWSKEFNVIDELDSVRTLPNTDNPHFIWQTKLVLVSLNPNVNLRNEVTEQVNGRDLRRQRVDEYLIVDDQFEIGDITLSRPSAVENEQIDLTVKLNAGIPEVYTREGRSQYTTSGRSATGRVIDPPALDGDEFNIDTVTNTVPFKNLVLGGNVKSANGKINLPFDFEFYGSDFNEVYVSRYGFLTLGDDAPSPENGDNGSSFSTGIGDQPAIAPYWDNLNAVRLYEVTGNFPDRQVTIQWSQTFNDRDSDPSNDFKLTFQAVLHESTNLIDFNYLEISTGGGSGATVGIGARPSDVGCPVFCEYPLGGNSVSTFLQDGDSIQFIPPEPGLLGNSYRAQQINSEFVDISSYGVLLNIPEDDDYIKIDDLPTGFQIGINGELSDLYVGKNGFVTFDNPESAIPTTNDDLSNGIGGVPAVAAFWDDLIVKRDDENENSGVYYRILGSDAGGDLRVIIQWEEVRSRAASSDPITFQIVIHHALTSAAEGLEESSILLRYEDVTASAPVKGGGTASIGYLAGLAEGGVLIGFNEPILEDGDAYLISEPAPLLELDVVNPEQRSDFVTIFPIDLTPDAVINPGPGDPLTVDLRRTLRTRIDGEIEPNEEVEFVVRYTYDNLNISSQKTVAVTINDSAGLDLTVNSDIVLDAPLSDEMEGIVHEGSSFHTLTVTLDSNVKLSDDSVIDIDKFIRNLQEQIRNSVENRIGCQINRVNREYCGVLPSDQFEDISGMTDKKLAITDTAAAVASLDGFPLYFYTDEATSLYVDSNGFLLPLTGSGDGLEQDFDAGARFGENSDLRQDDLAIPFLSGHSEALGIIAPLWDDLILGDDGAVYAARLGEPGAPDSRYIVQWDNVGFASGDGDSDNDNSITFQVVFYEGSGPRFEFRYKDVTVTNSDNSNGSGATIGTSADGTVGRYSHVSLNESILYDDSRVLLSVPTLELRTDQPEQFGAPFNGKAYFDLRPLLINTTTVTIPVEVYDDNLRERAMSLPLEVYAPPLKEDSRIELTGTSRREFLVIDNDLARATTLSVDRVRLAEGTSTAIQFEIMGTVENSTIRFNNMEVARITPLTQTVAPTADDVSEHGQADYSDYRVSFIPANGSAGREVAYVTDEGIVEVRVEALDDDYYELREDIEVMFQLHLSDNADGSVSFIDTYTFTLRIDDTDEPQIELVSDDPTRQDEDGARLELRAQLSNQPPLGNPGTISGTIRFNSVAERGVDFSVSGIGAPDGSPPDSIYHKGFGTFTIPRTVAVDPVRPVIATIEAIADNDPEPTEWIDLAITELEYQEYDTEQGIYYVKRIIDEYKLTDPDLIRFELEFANDDFVTASFNQPNVPVASEGEALPLQVVLDRPLPRLYAYTADLLDVSKVPDLAKLSSAATVIAASKGNDAATEKVPFDDFNFNFFGNSYDSVYVHRNGFVTFGEPIKLTYANADDADNEFLSQQPFIAPLWDALTIGSGEVTAVTLDTAPNRRFIIEWSGISFDTRTARSVGLRFQVILYEGSGQVQFNYIKVDADPAANDVNFGKSAWIGIGAGDGGTNVEIGHNQKIIENGTKITFTPPLKGLLLVALPESAEEFDDTFPVDVTNEFTLDEEPTLYVVAKQNDGPEDDRETHELGLDVANGEEIILASHISAVVTILDLDKPRVGFEQREYTVTEGSALTIMLELDDEARRDPLTTPVEVSLELGLDSTAGPSDYSITPERVTLSSTMTTAEFVINAASDILPDDGEFITLNLVSADTDKLTVNLPATVEITSRAPTVDIEITEGMITEGDTAEIVLTLSEPISTTRFNGSYSREDLSQVNFETIVPNSDKRVTDFTEAQVLPAEFDFEFYGHIYTEVYISPNGFVYFVGPNAPTNALMGIESNLDFRVGLPGYPVIAPLWDEYTPGAGGVYVEEFGTKPNRTYRIEWSSVTSTEQGGTSRSFQLFLHEGSNAIEINYETANANSATVAISGQPGPGLYQQLYFDEPEVVNNTRITLTPQKISDIVTVSSPIEYGPSVPRYIRAGEETLVGFDSGVVTGTVIKELRTDSNGNAHTDAVGVRQTLPFKFEFYNTIYEHIYVSNAGLIHFVGADDPAPKFTFDNPDFRENPPDYPTIAPLWDRHSIPAMGASVSITRLTDGGDAPNRSYRIEWNRLPVAGQPDADPFEFALILYEGSNYIDLLYKDANGNSATVAISGPRHSSGEIPFQQFHFNEQIDLDALEIRLRPQIFSDFESSGDYRLPRDFSLADFTGTDRPSLITSAVATIDNLYEDKLVDGILTHDTATVRLELAGEAELKLGDSRGQSVITLKEYSALAEFSQAEGGETFNLPENRSEDFRIILTGTVPNDEETTFRVRPRPVSEADSTDYSIDNLRPSFSNANLARKLTVTGLENGLVEPLENLQLYLEPEPDNDGSIVTRREPYNPDLNLPIPHDAEDAFIQITDTDPIELSLTVADGISQTLELSRSNGIEIGLIGSNLVGTGIGNNILVTLNISGSATRGEDYTLRGIPNTSREIGIPAGAQGTIIRLLIEDDDFYEPDETINISIDSASESVGTTEKSITLKKSEIGNEIEILIEDNDRIGVSLDRILPATIREGGTETELGIGLEEPVNFSALRTDDNYSSTESDFAQTIAIADAAIVTTRTLSEFGTWLADESEQEQFVEFELYGHFNRIGSDSHLFYREDGLVGFFQGRTSTVDLTSVGAASLESRIGENRLFRQNGQPAPGASDFFFAPLWTDFDGDTGVIRIAHEPQLNSAGDTIGYLPHIRWENLRARDFAESDITFGMRLLPDGKIQFYYETLDGIDDLDLFLTDTTIGIASGLASTRNEFYRKDMGDIQIQEGSVITFTPPDNVLRLTRSGGSPVPRDFTTDIPINLLRLLAEGVTEDTIPLRTQRDMDDEELEVIDLQLEIGGANPVFEIGETGSRRLSIFDPDATLVTATLALADPTQTHIEEGDRLTVRIRLSADVNVTSGFNLDTPHREDFNNQFPIDLLPLFPNEGEQVIDVPLITSRDLLSEGTETLRLFLTADNGTNIALEQATSELEVTVTDEIFVVSLEVLDLEPDADGQFAIDEGDPISVLVTLDRPLPLDLDLGGGYILNDGRVVDDNPVRYLEGANFDNIEYIAHSLNDRKLMSDIPIRYRLGSILSSTGKTMKRSI